MSPANDLEAAIRLAPHFTITVAARTHPYKSVAEMERYLDALGEAGMAE